MPNDQLLHIEIKETDNGEMDITVNGHTRRLTCPDYASFLLPQVPADKKDTIGEQMGSELMHICGQFINFQREWGWVRPWEVIDDEDVLEAIQNITAF